jgi:hypothetical protein
MSKATHEQHGKGTTLPRITFCLKESFERILQEDNDYFRLNWIVIRCQLLDIFHPKLPLGASPVLKDCPYRTVSNPMRAIRWELIPHQDNSLDKHDEKEQNH